MLFPNAPTTVGRVIVMLATSGVAPISTIEFQEVIFPVALSC